MSDTSRPAPWSPLDPLDDLDLIDGHDADDETRGYDYRDDLDDGDPRIDSQWDDPEESSW